jgi:hypothetical protein
MHKQFIYKEERSHLENYQKWSYLNRKERELWNDVKLTDQASWDLFNVYYGAYASTAFRSHVKAANRRASNV